MRILIYSEGRVGSHSLGKWLSYNLGIPFIHESINFDYENNDNFIKKIYFYPKNYKQLSSFEKEINFSCFDKIICLYREDTFSQSISYLQTIQTQQFRHSENKFDAYYEIDKQFCDNHYKEIYRTIKMSDKNNEELKNLRLGITLSYEQIFVKNIGQRVIEDYIGFEAIEPIYDPRYKLRIENKEVDLYLQELIENYKNSIKLI